MVQLRCYYTPLVGSVIRPMDSCHFQWPWMTSKVIRPLQGVSMQFNLCNILHGFNWHSASRGPSATAEIFFPAKARKNRQTQTDAHDSPDLTEGRLNFYVTWTGLKAAVLKYCRYIIISSYSKQPLSRLIWPGLVCRLTVTNKLEAIYNDPSRACLNAGQLSSWSCTDS